MKLSTLLKQLKPTRSQMISASMILSAGTLAIAAVPNIFTAGSTLTAAQMNDNFSSVDARIAALEAKLASMSVVTSNGQPTVRFSGVNLQVVNGLNTTDSVNGTGNLIVGYNEADTSTTYRCTIGSNPSTGAVVINEPGCTAAGGTWINTGFKTGSHYVIAGKANNYSQFGGLVVGSYNTSNNGFASVSGGVRNTASGVSSSVIGGDSNTAGGGAATVTGGAYNNASSLYTSISGGSSCTSAVTGKWIVGNTGSGCSTTLAN